MLDKYFNAKPRSTPNQKMEIQNPQGEATMPWVEKYRPNRLEQLAHQEEVTSSLKNVLKTGNLPHLLFYGPAGTGKTSAIIALAKELYGPKFYKQRVLELNASDERGINVVREKVKKFAQLVSMKNVDKNYLCPNYKIIILDEADLMTNDAQSALRRVIQDNSSSTRFCIICNYITKIIEPLSSRCVKFRFKPIPVATQLAKLEQICHTENVKLDQKQIMILLEKGDLRQSINSMQSLHKLSRIPNNLLPVSDDFCQSLMQSIAASSDIKEVVELAKEVNYEGYANDEILNGILNFVVTNEKNQRKKAIILEILSKAEESLILGSTELPIMEVLTSIYYVMNFRF